MWLKKQIDKGYIMINIIRKGNKSMPIVRFTCPECGCIFDADENSYLPLRNAEHKTYAYITCPDCGEDVHEQVTDINETNESKKSC